MAPPPPPPAVLSTAPRHTLGRVPLERRQTWRCETWRRGDEEEEEGLENRFPSEEEDTSESSTGAVQVGGGDRVV